MKIQDVDIDKVIPYANNPRNNDAGITKVAASIKAFGWQYPIIVDNRCSPEQVRGPRQQLVDFIYVFGVWGVFS